MKNNWGISKKSILFMSFFITMFSAHICIAKEANTIEEIFRQGKISGEIGDYFEFVEREASDSNSGWSTAHISLKYETLPWNHLKFGARFWAHGELYNDHDDSTTDTYEIDIENKFTLPEMYLDYGFLENSSVRVGRWQNVGHIDDAQSEGGYLSFKEIENLELIVGAMTRFAEIDYDDSEDFGRSNDSQDVDSESTYGPGSGPMVVFLEGKYQPFKALNVNPYFMYHDDYANVIGIDTKVDMTWEKYDVKYGGAVKYLHVNADINNRDDANSMAIQPYVAKGPVTLDFSYSKFADGNALNKPAWLLDTFSIVDQDEAENNPGAEVFEARMKYSLEKLWLSYAYATATYETSATEGEGYSDNEFQIGYKITDNLDVNVRYFIVTFDEVDGRDYNKVESRIRFKF